MLKATSLALSRNSQGQTHDIRGKNSKLTNETYCGKIVTPIIVEHLESALTNYAIRLKTEIISRFKLSTQLC